MKEFSMALLSAAGAGVSNFMIVLFAQVGDINPGVLSLVGNGVTIVVLAWYVIYDVRTRTPNMIDTFRREQKEAREAHAAELEHKRQHYSHIIETLRNEQQLMRTMFTQEQSHVREAHEKQLSELRSILYENMRSMRAAVHDMKDAINPLVLKQEIKKLEDERRDLQHKREA